MSLKTRLVRQLRNGREFLLTIHLMIDLHDGLSDFDSLALEFEAAANAIRSLEGDAEIPMKGHLLDMLIALSKQYEGEGFAFQSRAVDDLINEIAGWKQSASASAAVDKIARNHTKSE